MLAPFVKISKSLCGILPEELVHHRIGDRHSLRLRVGLRLSKFAALTNAMMFQEPLVNLLVDSCLLDQKISLLLQLDDMLVDLLKLLDQVLLVVVPAVGLLELLLNYVF